MPTSWSDKLLTLQRYSAVSVLFTPLSINILLFSRNAILSLGNSGWPSLVHCLALLVSPSSHKNVTSLIPSVDGGQVTVGVGILAANEKNIKCIDLAWHRRNNYTKQLRPIQSKLSKLLKRTATISYLFKVKYYTTRCGCDKLLQAVFKICLFWHHNWVCPPRCVLDRSVYKSIQWTVANVAHLSSYI